MIWRFFPQTVILLNSFQTLFLPTYPHISQTEHLYVRISEELAQMEVGVFLEDISTSGKLAIN